MIHIHYHACVICDSHTMVRKAGQPNPLKMCPCREAYYCGPEHQKLHWSIHKQTCFQRKHKEPLSALDVGVQYLIQSHDGSLVELAIKAMVKEDVNVDLERAIETQAVEFNIEPLESMEDLKASVADGKIPRIKLSRSARIVSIAEEAAHRGLGRPYFEHPADRQLRIRRNRYGVVMIFQPGGRVVTKAAPAGQLPIWQMMQRHEQTTTNPPTFFLSIHSTNAWIRGDIDEEKNPEAAKERQKSLDAVNKRRTGALTL